MYFALFCRSVGIIYLKNISKNIEVLFSIMSISIRLEKILFAYIRYLQHCDTEIAWYLSLVT